jgi:hypothetical protein
MLEFDNLFKLQNIKQSIKKIIESLQYNINNTVNVDVILECFCN